MRVTLIARRTHHGTVLKGEVIRELVNDIGGDTIVPGKRAVIGRGRSEDNIWAELVASSANITIEEKKCSQYLVPAALASITLAAGCTGLHCDAVTDLEVLDRGADYGMK